MKSTATKPAKAKPAMTDEQLSNAKDEAMLPELTKDQAVFGYDEHRKVVQVRYLPLGPEKTIVKALVPHLSALQDILAKGDELKAGIIDLDSLQPLVLALSDVLPECVAAAFEDQGITLEWLNQHSDLGQVFEAAMKQMAKIRSLDLLGKLLRSGGRKS